MTEPAIDPQLRREAAYRKWSLRWSALAALGSALAAIGAVVGIVLAYDAFSQARRQADAAIDQNRPWVQVERLDIDKIVRSENELSLDITGIVKDYGHAPASGLQMFSHVYFLGERPTDSVNLAALECSEMERLIGSRHTQGGVVFPDQTSVARDDDRRRKISDMRQSFATITAHDQSPKSFDEYSKSMNLEIFGCLLYDYWGQKMHVTSFDFYFKNVDLSKVFVSEVSVQGKRNLAAIGFAD